MGWSHAVSSMHSMGPALLVEKTSWGQGWLVGAMVELGEDLGGWIWLQLGLSQNRSGKEDAFPGQGTKPAAHGQRPPCPTGVLHVHVNEPKPTAGQGPAAGHGLIRAILVSLRCRFTRESSRLRWPTSKVVDSMKGCWKQHQLALGSRKQRQTPSTVLLASCTWAAVVH